MTADTGKPGERAGEGPDDLLTEAYGRLDQAQRRWIRARDDLKKAEADCWAALRGIEAIKAEARDRITTTPPSG